MSHFLRSLEHVALASILIFLCACASQTPAKEKVSYRGILDHGDKPSNIYTLEVVDSGIRVGFSIGANGETREFKVRDSHIEGRTISFVCKIPGDPDADKKILIELAKDLGPETVSATIRYPSGTTQEILFVRDHGK